VVRISRMLFCVIAGTALAGCQSYRARPLDPAAHLAAYLARDPAAALGRPAAEERGPARDLTLQEAETVALVFNPELRLARAKAGVTAAAAEYAGLWEDPVLGADVRRIVESTPEPWISMGMVSFTLPVSGRLGVEKRLAGAEREADVARVFEQEWRTRVEVRRRWAEWSGAAERAAAIREFLERLEGIVGIVDRLEAAGEMARVEARLFRVERATRGAELRVVEAEAQRRAVELKRVLGLAPRSPVRLALRTDWSVATTPGAGDESGAEPNPSVAVARSEYEASERSLELEVRKQYPDLVVGPGFGTEDGLGRVILGVSVPVPILNANRQGIARARAAREAARVAWEGAVERIIGERAVAAADLRAAGAQREALEREVVPLVEAQYADALRIAQLGSVNTAVLLESLSRQQEARLKLIEARAAEAVATIRLEELAGPSRERSEP